MDLILRNVNQRHIGILEELSKILKFQVMSDVNSKKNTTELDKRMKKIENETSLICPNWENIAQQANLI